MSRPVVVEKTAASAAARRPWGFFILVVLLGAVIVLSAGALWRRDPAMLGWVTFGYLGYELGLNALLVAAAWLGLREMRSAERGRRKEEEKSSANASEHSALSPSPLDLSQAPVRTPPSTLLSVLIAAHNERGCIADTLESVFAQAGVELEIIVASDGSRDGMVAMLAADFDGERRLRVLDLPKVGKGAALNASLAAARGEIVVTLDADTRLAAGALAELAAVFAKDARVASAGGFVYVRNAAAGAGGSWITRYQFWEYLKNFMWRIGLAHLGVCLQVSGAFGAFRTKVLREELGGFSEASLVEDYEIIFRLHERLRRAGRGYRVAVAPGAVAYTDGPETVAAFLHQRTRWFAGFLQTLWDYRGLVGDRRMEALGWFMLPIKCVDAVLPLWGFLSLGILLAAAASSEASVWQRAALLAFAGKWAADVLLSAIMWRWHAREFPGRAGMPGAPRLAWCVLTEGLVFNWFRQVAVLNAYGWFARRVRRWHQPRWEASRLENQASRKLQGSSSELPGWSKVQGEREAEIAHRSALDLAP